VNSTLLLTAVAAAALSGLPLALRRWRGAIPERLATVLLWLAAGLGAWAAVDVLAHGAAAPLRLPCNPLLPVLTFGLDPLAAVFALPVCLLCAAASIYDLGYWPGTGARSQPAHVRRWLGILLGSLLLLLAAQDGVAFLLAWEAMALAAFFLVATEHGRADVRGAGWIYLASTHAGTLLLVAFFGVFAATTGSFELSPLPAGTATDSRDLLFLLALAGFGMKAGFVPLHFWLPVAHAAAPSHVSAVMSGVLIKMGIYGLLRALWLMPDPPLWWGVSVLGLGVLSALAGVAFAIAQHDLKRLLAYHSIENIGIIGIGLGTALLGRATGRGDLAALGLGGALLHVWNHALFKGLLFFAAGAAIHAAGTRAIDQLGGLARRMPQTAACFLVGAVAICGLPPLNGFVSELLTYLGLFRALGEDGTIAGPAMVAIPALAMVGAMALLCFVKVYGVVFAGERRHPGPHEAHEPHEAAPALRLPMFLLAAFCLGIGLLPGLALPALQPVVDGWCGRSEPTQALAELLPCGWIGALGVTLLALTALLWAWLHRRRQHAGPAVGTWDCGYLRPSPSMQYTASSFAQQFVDCNRFVLLPVTRRPRLQGLFVAPTHLLGHVPDPVLDRLLLPLLHGLAVACSWMRALQRGHVQLYLLYVFLTLLCLLMLC
jgi:hydrogenase-4 component B